MEQALREARSADSTYLPALAFFSPYAYLPPSLVAELDRFALALSDTTLGACMRDLVSARLGAWHPIEAPSHVSEAAKACLASHRLFRPFGLENDEGLALARLLYGRFPENPEYAALLLDRLSVSDRKADLTQVAKQMTQASMPALTRVYGYSRTIQLLHNSGRQDEAVRVEREAEAETRRQGAVSRFGFLWEQRGLHADLGGHIGLDSAVIRHARATERAASGELENLAPHAGLHVWLNFLVARATERLDHGDLKASVRDWDRLAVLADSLAAPELQGQVRVRRGRALVKLGRTAEAERDLLAGREYAQRARHSGWQFEAEHNLLHLYEAAGRDGEARRAGEAFVALTRSAGAATVHQMANRDLALYYERRGERERARPYFEAVLVYADTLGGQYAYWAGEYFELTGDLQRAEEFFLRGESNVRANSALARLAEATGDLDRAAKYAAAHDGQALRTPEFVPMLPGILARHGRLMEALSALDTARRVADRRGQVAAWATLSAELATYLLRLGQWGNAVHVADSAADAARRVAATEVRLGAQAVSALARVRLGGTERGVGVTRLRSTLGEAEGMHVPQLLADVYGYAGEAEIARGRRSAGLAFLGRAAKLTDSIAISLSEDPKRAGFRAAQIHVSNVALEALLDRDVGADGVKQFAAWSVQRKSRGLLERGDSAREFRDAFQLHALKTLGERDAVVDFVVLDTSVAALVITDRATVLQRLPVRADSLSSRIARFLGRLVPRLGNEIDTLHARFDTRLARQLYLDLIAPLERVLAGRDRLTIIPDGPLHQLPFDALIESGDSSLPHGADSAMHYALDRFTISYSPSLALLGENAQASHGRVLAIAGPSAAGSPEEEGDARREVAAVTSAFGASRVDALSGHGATEAEFRARASAAAVLHIAAHARANDADPGSAFIALFPAGADDGALHAYEIDRLHLPGSLVVLSACETGAGRLSGGEGVLSLSRAFLRAGASATVATLWPVGGATVELMDRFYAALAAGVAPAEALRRAKLALRRGANPSPLYWAPFILVTRV